MKRVLQADKIKVVVAGEEAEFVAKKGYEALVVLAEGKLTITHADNADGTNAVEYKEYDAEDGDQVNVDIVGAMDFIKVENGAALVFGDKRDVHEVIGAEPDHQLHGFIDKERNWDR